MTFHTESQKYHSTRSSGSGTLTFEEAVITGLATDGGLFIPTAVPSAPADFLETWKDLSFQELAFNILSLYISRSEISEDDLKSLIERSYSTFREKDVTPLRALDKSKGLYLLELFHGPTYAFKDVALQFVGNLFEYFLQRKNEGKAESSTSRDTITVVGATSGDTGSAAIYGLRNKKDVSVFILYPTGRISPIQEAQMTTVLDKNVHTLSVKGTFDDCQDIVKQVFGDVNFNAKYHIGAVNSINWARILAQITYYFHSYFNLKKQVPTGTKVRFVVPSGNFGDILAGWFAKRMGLPIDELIIATNSNDILDRFMKTGRYEKSADASVSAEVKSTLSPAMDILISSNFERLLWFLVRENDASSNAEAGKILNQWMSQLKTVGSVTVPESVISGARKEFSSECVNDKQTLETINKIYTSDTTRYVIDPHTSVGVTSSLRRIAQDAEKGTKDVAYISLSTAHPAKFADAVNDSLSSVEGYSFEESVLPDELKLLSTKERKIKLVEKADLELVKSVIVEELEKEKESL